VKERYRQQHLDNISLRCWKLAGTAGFQGFLRSEDAEIMAFGRRQPSGPNITFQIHAKTCIYLCAARLQFGFLARIVNQARNFRRCPQKAVFVSCAFLLKESFL
jgi:hypothetical protein